MGAIGTKIEDYQGERFIMSMFHSHLRVNGLSL